MRHTELTLLILQLNSLLDSGQYDSITLDEVKKRIRDGSVLDYIQERAGRDVDLGLHLSSAAFTTNYIAYLQAILDGYDGDEARRWGVKNRGLCLLIAWTNEILQQGSGWTPNHDVSVAATTTGAPN